MVKEFLEMALGAVSKGVTLQLTDIIRFVDFTGEQLERYSRQLVLDEIGSSGQKKLLESRVLVLGAGGLGSAAITYLARSGIGTIGVVDYDRVELSNLHRQIIHNTLDLNKPKVVSAKEKINKINPEVKLILFEERLAKTNIEKIFKDFEIIVDGLDSFKDKFLVNEYSVKLRKKLVHAGVIGFEGQVLTVMPGESACLKCFFPDNEPADFRQSCKEIGVLGPCVGVIAALQATEVIKLILGIGELLTNRVLKYNALNQIFYEFKIDDMNKNCLVCSKQLVS